jgi:hypothetical protein
LGGAGLTPASQRATHDERHQAALNLVARSLVKQKRALAAGARKNSILRFAGKQNG